MYFYGSSLSNSLFILLVISVFVRSCPVDQQRNGCKIVANTSGSLSCVCGMGCRRDFTFRSRHQCQVVLIGSFYPDPCQPNPCLNSGLCFQLGSGGLMCQCTGTMWYGDRCQHECPEKIGGNAFGLEDALLPLECR